MNRIYAGGPTLVNWLLDFLWDRPNGATLAQIVRAFKSTERSWRVQSIPPTLTYLKDLGLLRREDSIWRAVKKDETAIE